MKIAFEQPPNIEEIRAVFPLSGREIFAWGDTIYNPNKLVLPEQAIAHERVHSMQQGDAVVAWWERYLVDPEWRLEQELAAHRAEYRNYILRHKDRNVRARYLREVANKLASPMYGGIISPSRALKLIRS